MKKRVYKMKSIVMIVYLILGLSISLLGREYNLFPGIGNLNEVRGKHTISTIDNKVFFDPKVPYLNKVLINNRLLLQKASDLSLTNNKLTSQELKDIEQNYIEISKLIDKADLSKKLQSAVVGYVTVDAKALFDVTWLIISDLVKENYKDSLEKHTTLNMLLNIAEQIVLTSIDIAIEKYGVNTSLFYKFIPEILSKGFGTATAIYDGVVNTTKLINTLSAIVEVNNVVRKQAYDMLVVSFIYDYIFKYKSNINEMYKDTVKIPSSEVINNYNNFWTLWNEYQRKNNRSLRYKLGNGTALAYAAALETNKLLEKYDKNFFINIGMREWVYDDGEKYLSFFADPSTLNKKYFLPDDVKFAGYNGLYNSFLHGDFAKDKKLIFTVYFTGNFTENNKIIDGTLQKKNVLLIHNARIRIKAINDKGKDVVSREIKLEQFYVPNFLSDITKKYWASKSIFKLFKKNIISGYDDGKFKPKNDVTIGQFLKMITNAIYLSTDKSKLIAVSKTNNIDFSNYANFLKDKKVDIGLEDSEYKIQLASEASRGYIAKVITSIMADKGFTKKISCSKTSGDWNKCSDFLNSKCIAIGSDGKYLPLTNITRDEVAVMIVRTMNVVGGDKLTCTDRHGKDIK